MMSYMPCLSDHVLSLLRVASLYRNWYEGSGSEVTPSLEQGKVTTFRTRHGYDKLYHQGNSK